MQLLFPNRRGRMSTRDRAGPALGLDWLGIGYARQERKRERRNLGYFRNLITYVTLREETGHDMLEMPLHHGQNKPQL